MAVIGRAAERQQESTAVGEKVVFLQRMCPLLLISRRNFRSRHRWRHRLDRSRYKWAQESLNKPQFHCSLKHYTKCEGLRGT